MREGSLMFSRLAGQGCRIVAVTWMVVCLHGVASAAPRPWLPMPRYQLVDSGAVLSGELDRAVASRRASEPGVAVALVREGRSPEVRYAGVESLDRGAPIGPQ